MKQLSRNERRRMKAQRQAIAGVMANSCYDYDASGKRVPVTDPEAIAVLERAFSRLLQENGEPQVIRISEAAARAFPRYQAKRVPFGATSWLGVAFDPAMQAAYCLRHVAMHGDASPTEERRVAEAYVRAGLEEACAYAGFPQEVPAS